MSTNAPTSKGQRWTSYLLSGLPALFLLFGSINTLLKTSQVMEGMAKYGYPESAVQPLGIAALLSVALYAIPRTAVLGAILLTGYLGGAVATHVRAGDPWFNILLPVLFGMLLWGGLYLRDERLRALLPLRN